MDPVLGFAADYSTNPVLLAIPDTAQADAAVLIDDPTTYNADNERLTLEPSFRLSNRSGYSSVTSDYEHFLVKNELDTQRSVFTAVGGVDQDSSLFHDFLTNGSTGVKRDTALADLNWDLHLTERFEFDVDLSPSRVRYAQGATIENLVDYKNIGIAPSITWLSDERTKVSLSAEVGRYNSLNGMTESRNVNLQAGFTRRLSEIWTLSVTAGFSRALNRSSLEEEFVVETPTGPAIEIIPVNFESAQNGAVYLVNAVRQGSQLSLNASASRQLAPTGFAFLSRQDTLDLTANYLLSDRWSIGGDAKRVKYQSPGTGGTSTEVDVSYLTFNADWKWTEHWTVIFAASHVASKYSSTAYSAKSNEITLTLSRQFNHIAFD
jgi:hypothetical protein